MAKDTCIKMRIVNGFISYYEETPQQNTEKTENTRRPLSAKELAILSTRK